MPADESAPDPFNDTRAYEATFHLTAAPSWVVYGEIDWAATGAADEHVFTLMSHTQWSPAEFVRHERNVRRLVTREAVQKLSQIEVEWDPAIEVLNIHEVAIWRSGVKRSFAQRQRFLLRQREGELESAILHGRMSAIVLLDDVRPGDAIELEFSIHSSARLSGELFDARYAVERPMTTVDWQVTLRLPPDMPLYWRADPTAPVVVEKHEPSMILRTWAGRQRVPAEFDVGTPPWVIPHGIIDVSGYASWAEVAKCVAGAWAEVDASADSLRRQAADLAASASTLEDKAQAVIHWVQDHVRYLGLETGAGGLRPRPSAEVLDQRYGDCKDKTLLLCTLLRCLGIEADPVLVHTELRHTVADRIPGLGAFNHAIASFVIGGRRGFVDATVAGEGGTPFDRCLPSYRKGLILRLDTTELADIPSATVERSALLVTEDFHLHASKGESHIAWRIEASGWEANMLRGRFQGVGGEIFAKSEAEDLRQYFPDAKHVGVAEVADDLKANRFIVWGRVAIAEWGQVEANGFRQFQYKPRWIYHFLIAPVRNQKRTYPFYVRYPAVIRHEIRVHSRGHQFATRLKLRSKTEWFHSATSIERSSGNLVEAIYTYQSLANTIEASASSAFQEALESAAANQLGLTLAVRWSGGKTVKLPDDFATRLPPPLPSTQLSPPRMSLLAADNAQNWLSTKDLTKPSVVTALWRYFTWTREGKSAAIMVAIFGAIGAVGFFAEQNKAKNRLSPASLRDAIHQMPKSSGAAAPWSKLQETIDALDKGEAERGAKLLSQVTSVYGDSPDLAAVQARLAATTGDWDFARARSSYALRKSPSHPGALLVQSQDCLTNQKDKSRAEALADSITNANPTYAPGWAQSSFVQNALGRRTLAETYAEKAISLQPDLFIGHVALIDAREAARKQEDAIAAAEAALVRFPTSSHLHRWLGLQNRALNRPDESLRHAREAERLAPNMPILTAELAYALAKAGAKTEAIDVAKRALARATDDLGVLGSIASAFALAGDLDQASKMHQDIVIRSPTAFNRNNLGYTFLLMGKFQEAKEQLETAAELEPKNLLVWQNLAKLYATTGDTARQSQALQRCTELGSN